MSSELLDEMNRLRDEITGEDEEKEAELKAAETFARRKKVLVIDDNGMTLRTIKEFLDKNYVVAVANSGPKGIEKVTDFKPDVIILDYEMPGMNGLETYERIKTTEAGKDIPIIYLTSADEKYVALTIISQEPAGYILKPPSVFKVTKAIEHALKQSNQKGTVE